MRNAIMQVKNVLNGSIVNLLFYCHIILLILSQSVFLWEIWHQAFSLSPNCRENFRDLMLLMEITKCWKIFEVQKISIKMKNFKIFCEAQTESRLKQIIQSPHQINQLSYEDVQEYRDICFQVLWERSSSTSWNGAV